MTRLLLFLPSPLHVFLSSVRHLKRFRRKRRWLASKGSASTSGRKVWNSCCCSHFPSINTAGTRLSGIQNTETGRWCALGAADDMTWILHIMVLFYILQPLADYLGCGPLHSHIQCRRLAVNVGTVKNVALNDITPTHPTYSWSAQVHRPEHMRSGPQ